MSAHNLPYELFQSDFAIADPGNAGLIAPTKSPAVASLVTAAAETRKLSAPVSVGQRVTLCLRTDGGNCVVTTLAAVNVAGNNTLTFDNAGETIELVGVWVGSSLRWHVASNDGVGLSTV